MKKKKRKTIYTLMILVVSIALFVVFIYIKANNDKVIPSYAGVLVAIIPAFLINNIWNPKNRKDNKM